ncbi:hypothetical protein [Neorhodopirellula pilleata]|uniref:Uncharacterized protein n=1 Tax=Neorhodopirellula pilleata TaxID=2714738 RepID=A0A5C6A8P2_9BACT|nr:hypothetical protein [Neorhodopirellula pilleata]TWT95678.1 hypothetical protein Pla100_33190 [Neorhodopirellula pilleata]
MSTSISKNTSVCLAALAAFTLAALDTNIRADESIPGSDPHTITMKSTTPGQPSATAMGIYRLEDDKWTLCYALPGNERPKKFKSTEEDHTMLMVMRRPK